MEIEDITKKVATELPASETIEHPLPDSAEGVKALEKESSEGHDGIVIQEPCEEQVIEELPIEETQAEDSRNLVLDCENSSRVFLKTFNVDCSAYVLGASLRGRSHEMHETQCQDYHAFEYIENGWYILSVSDGAGSARCAERGSKANSTFAIKLIKELLEQKQWVESNYFPSELEWYIESRSIFERIKLIIRTKVSELEGDYVETDFNATLLMAIVTPQGVLCAHVGDGRMGLLTQENEWIATMTPHKGEEANQTLFLQSGWTSPRVPAFNVAGIYVPETRVFVGIPKAIVLMTDGCERASWECSIMDPELGKYVDKNRPYHGFMNPLLDALNETKDDEKLQLFIDIIDHGTNACEREIDDKTMLLMVQK